jgi:dTDP-4-amino-4,6-dideoxygalactose transaminase
MPSASFLAKRGIATVTYYPVPLHRQECFRAFAPAAPLSVAETAAAEALSLAVFPELT